MIERREEEVAKARRRNEYLVLEYVPDSEAFLVAARGLPGGTPAGLQWIKDHGKVERTYVVAALTSEFFCVQEQHLTKRDLCRAGMPKELSPKPEGEKKGGKKSK